MTPDKKKRSSDLGGLIKSDVTRAQRDFERKVN